MLTVHHFLRFFEPPGAKTTSKKPFRLVKHKVLFRLSVKSLGLAAFLADKPWPNRDFWRSQSAKPRFLRVERGVGGASAVEFWLPRAGFRGRWVTPVGGILGVYTFGIDAGLLDFLKRPNIHQHAPRRPSTTSSRLGGRIQGATPSCRRPPEERRHDATRLRGHEAIALVTCAS